jgi:hypothetical protein
VAALHAIVHAFTQPHVLVALAVFSFFAFLATVILVPMLLVRMPADYLLRPEHAGRRNPVAVVFKNVAGVMLALLGIALLLLPGQGLLTLVLGLSLVDFPGRRRLVRHLMTRPPVLKAINALRRRASRPPLEVPPG